MNHTILIFLIFHSFTQSLAIPYNFFAKFWLFPKQNIIYQVFQFFYFRFLNILSNPNTYYNNFDQLKINFFYLLAN